MGAMTKVKVCLPVQTVSNSRMTTARLSMSKGKKLRIMGRVLALTMILTSGWRRTSSSRVAQWSGSMWLTTR